MAQAFLDFEQKWIEMGEEFQVAFESGNSPEDPYQVEEDKPSPKQSQPTYKRKLSESEDSLILLRRKMKKENSTESEGFSQQTKEEHPLLKTFREDNPGKYTTFEKRIRSTFTLTKPVCNTLTVSHKPASTESGEFNPPVPIKSQGYSPSSPDYSPSSPNYSPVSPDYSPVSPDYSTASTPVLIKSEPTCTVTPMMTLKTTPQAPLPSFAGYSQVSSEYSPASTTVLIKSEPTVTPMMTPTTTPQAPLPSFAGYSQVSSENSPASPPVLLKSEPTVNPMMTRITTPPPPQSTPSLSPVVAPGFWMPPNNYPLKEELNALNELVDNVRVDLLQTSMVVHYIQDFMKKFQ